MGDTATALASSSEFAVSLQPAQTRYELDKSSLASALTMKHAMVVDAITVTPAVTVPATRMLLDVGVQRELRSLAACHSMRLTFVQDLEVSPSVFDDATLLNPRASPD